MAFMAQKFMLGGTVQWKTIRQSNETACSGQFRTPD